MSTKINGLETKVKSIEESREFESKFVGSLQAKQKEIFISCAKNANTEAEQKEKLLDL